LADQKEKGLGARKGDSVFDNITATTPRARSALIRASDNGVVSENGK